MRTLAANELVALWDASSLQSAHLRLEPLLTAASGDGSIRSDVLGRRNQRLIEFYQCLTDRPMEARLRCLKCNTDNEFAVPTSNILGCVTPDPSLRIELRSGAKRLRFRIPDMRDVHNLLETPPKDARLSLARSCLERGPTGALTNKLLRLLDRRFEDADPAGRILLDLVCAGCGHQVRASVDIAEIVAAAVDQLVDQLLREVHVLAATYGWSEASILNLPTERRRRYLALIANSVGERQLVRAR